MRERVVQLEAQRPHIEASLERIEKMVDKLNGHLSKVIWGCAALLMAAVGKWVLGGGLNIPHV